ncbi:aspartate/glutamate racemase family protein [Nitrospira sp. BLG_2]|uniref:aspartate/glutamate racemase family protein n=1 Tax=Nitrospira sp. BLG_2 TaxID=3397507 RepID=UPI003B9B0B41
MGRRHAHPEISLHSFPLHWYLDAIEREDWEGVAALMSQSAAKLEQAGADYIICPNNTLHRAFSLVESSIPWLHIAKPVVEEVVEHQWRRIGILGTQTVMEGGVYTENMRQSGIGTMVPKKDDRIRIQQIIRNELVAGLFTSKSRACVQNIVADMARKGAEAVILACTELPLLMSGHHAALPMLDSTRLLARAALRDGIQSRKHPEKQHGRSPVADRADRTIMERMTRNSSITGTDASHSVMGS